MRDIIDVLGKKLQDVIFRNTCKMFDRSLKKTIPASFCIEFFPICR